MPEKTINDTKLLRLVDKEKMTQTQAAAELGVSRQAVNSRLKQLRGRTTHAMIAGRIDKVIDRKIDTFAQLEKINSKANKLLDDPETDMYETIKLMAEIRSQLKLHLELFQTMWDIRAAEEFQDTVLTIIGQVDPEIRKRILQALNAKSAFRNSVSFR